MARVNTEAVTGWSHCTNARCEGRKQTETPAVRETVEHTYKDSDGDMPGVEKSQVYFRFADEQDAVCPTCEGPREITDQRRAVYENLSGKSQDGLLEYKPVTV